MTAKECYYCYYDYARAIQAVENDEEYEENGPNQIDPSDISIQYHPVCLKCVGYMSTFLTGTLLKKHTLYFVTGDALDSQCYICGDTWLGMLFLGLPIDISEHYAAPRNEVQMEEHDNYVMNTCMRCDSTQEADFHPTCFKCVSDINLSHNATASRYINNRGWYINKEYYYFEGNCSLCEAYCKTKLKIPICNDCRCETMTKAAR